MNWLTNIFTKHAANWLVFGVVISGGTYHISSRLLKAEMATEEILRNLELNPVNIKTAVKEVMVPKIDSISAKQKEMEEKQDRLINALDRHIRKSDINTEEMLNQFEMLYKEKKNSDMNHFVN